MCHLLCTRHIRYLAKDCHRLLDSECHQLVAWYGSIYRQAFYDI